MAEFSKLIITEKGKELMAKAVANTAVIKFTKISSSDKAYEFDELKTLETLIGVKQTFSGPSVKRVNATSVKINAAFHNVELTEGYYLRAIGLHAEDPDTGEILYGVASEMSGNCYMPAYNGITSSGIYLKLVTKVGDTGNVSMEIDPAAVATIGDVEELRNSLEVVDFDDSGEVEGIGSFSDFMSSFVKRTPVYKLLENLKAGLKYVLHTGQLVNNGLCEIPGQFPLDAAYGKTLTDQITGLYSDLGGFEPIIDEIGKITGYKTTVGGADTVFPFSEIDKQKLVESLQDSGMGITIDTSADEIYDKLSTAIFIQQGQIWPDSLPDEFSWSVTFSFGGIRWGWSDNYSDTYTQTITFTLIKDGSLYSRSSIRYSGDKFYTNYISSYSKTIESLPSDLKSYPLSGSFRKSISLSGYKTSGSGTLSVNFSNKLCTVTETFSVSGNDGKPAVSSWETSFAWPQTYMGKVTLFEQL